MNKHSFTKPIITVGLLLLVGAVGAQTYYTHELVHRVADTQSDSRDMSKSAPAEYAGRWDPWATMHAERMRMAAQMDQMFDNAMQDIHSMPGSKGLNSGGEVTLKEQDDSYLVKADIPGAKESDISINLDGRLLSISAQTQTSEEQSSDNGQTIHEERYASSFQQAFTLPGPVQASGMHSQFQDGVLTVTIPKSTS